MSAVDREKLRRALEYLLTNNPHGRHDYAIAEAIFVLDAAPALPAGLPDVETLRKALVEAGQWIASLGTEESSIVAAQIAAALEGSATEPSDR